MAPASASLLPATSSTAGAKRPAAAAASDAEHPLAQECAAGKNNQSQQQQKQLECPRCGSGNTKFSYYNNYSSAQPRHFCRTCRRYWTHGGTLRRVPVGGACRRNKRRRSAEPQTPSSGSPPPADQDARNPRPDHPLPVFPFLTDGDVFLPQFDLGLGAPAGFPWTSTTPDLYDGLMAPWSGGLAASAWDDFGGLELTWPPPAAGN